MVLEDTYIDRLNNNKTTRQTTQTSSPCLSHSRRQSRDWKTEPLLTSGSTSSLTEEVKTPMELQKIIAFATLMDLGALPCLRSGTLVTGLTISQYLLMRLATHWVWGCMMISSTRATLRICSSCGLVSASTHISGHQRLGGG